KEAGLTKQDVRELSKALGLPTWDKPSYACMSSRFPYGQTITPEKLSMVAQAEEFLRGLGLRQFRVRHHDTIARIEVPPADLPRLVNGNLRAQIIRRLKEIGYAYVTLDLEGYRTGSMNEVLPEAVKSQRPKE
ncbi:MAG: TIGR00268 family protein, partial [Planctomycetes bacterium]|nr:TIGR00268 family protein [Planctomycetota bacterium]